MCRIQTHITNHDGWFGELAKLTSSSGTSTRTGTRKHAHTHACVRHTHALPPAPPCSCDSSLSLLVWNKRWAHPDQGASSTEAGWFILVLILSLFLTPAPSLLPPLLPLTRWSWVSGGNVGSVDNVETEFLLSYFEKNKESWWAERERKVN